MAFKDAVVQIADSIHSTHSTHSTAPVASGGQN